VTSHFNRLTPEQAEALAILAEECGEVVQVIGKIQRHGLESRNPNDPCARINQALLIKELGDVLAAVDICHQVQLVTPEAIEFCMRAKLLNVGKWLHHIKLDEGP
jgi:NTP pyrophosphatase (non-canonical NTP hydrolase)